MSLINDALRRAGESSRRNRRRPPSPLSALQPVDRLDRGGSGLKWVGFLMALSFGAAVWLLWRTGQPSAAPPTSVAGAPPLEIVRPAPASELPPTVPTEPPPVEAEEPEVLTQPEQIRVNTNLVTRSELGIEAATETPKPDALELERESEAEADGVLAGSFPDVRLQSIIFSSTDPLAMINGQTVAQGEAVGGVVVLEVRRDSVLLLWGDEQRELRLPEL